MTPKPPFLIESPFRYPFFTKSPTPFCDTLIFNISDCLLCENSNLLVTLSGFSKMGGGGEEGHIWKFGLSALHPHPKTERGDLLLKSCTFGHFWRFLAISPTHLKISNENPNYYWNIIRRSNLEWWWIPNFTWKVIEISTNVKYWGENGFPRL